MCTRRSFGAPHLSFSLPSYFPPCGHINQEPDPAGDLSCAPCWWLVAADGTLRKKGSCWCLCPMSSSQPHQFRGVGVGKLGLTQLLSDDWVGRTSTSPQPDRFLLEPQRLRDGFRPAGWMDEGPGHLRDLLLAHPNRNYPVGTPWPSLPITGKQPPRGILAGEHVGLLFLRGLCLGNCWSRVNLTLHCPCPFASSPGLASPMEKSLRMGNFGR